MTDPSLQMDLRARIRNVIAQWVSGERAEGIINQALAEVEQLPAGQKEARALGFAVAQAQPKHERDQLFKVLFERVSRFAASRVGADHADDIASKAIQTLIERYPDKTRLEDLMPLTTTIAMNHIRHQWRRTTTDVRNPTIDGDDYTDPTRDPEQQTIVRNLIDRMMEAMKSKRFKEDCRKLLKLIYSGVPYEEIQKIMGARTMATVYTWSFRCHNRLRDCLGGSFLEGGTIR